MVDPEHIAPSSCRSCGAVVETTVVDLGMSPLCQTVIPPARAAEGEIFYPLRADVCERCWLVQVGDVVSPEGLFQQEYPYFSSFSDSWLDHARSYVDQVVEVLDLGPDSTVVEIGSNDGYLLQWVVQAGIRCMGVDPAANVADAAAARGVQTTVAFFGLDTARDLVARGWQADLVCGANVMAQVPDLNDFVAGLAALVAPTGTVTIEFPSLMAMIDHTEFDTIYHEHFSYFSLLSTEVLFARHGLQVTRVQQLATHGGSYRIWARPSAARPPVDDSVAEIRAAERSRGLDTVEYYRTFADEVLRVRRDLVDFLYAERDAGRAVVGYGAPGKGNTLLNFCGIRPDLLAYTVDRNPAKQGTLLPGSRIPVHPTEMIAQTRPDTILILPWNLRVEIASQLAHTAEWGARLVVPIPRLEALPA
jgi:SAM-dependent methyltransferase